LHFFQLPALLKDWLCRADPPQRVGDHSLAVLYPIACLPCAIDPIAQGKRLIECAYCAQP
jgi:hypothetical protein